LPSSTNSKELLALTEIESEHPGKTEECMTESSGSKDQQHPLYHRDRPSIDILLAQEPTDYNLAELARLKIRYLGFPGARDIQKDLDQVLQRLGLTEAELFAKTRELHDQGGIYPSRGKKNEEDWN
jgi:hypothetical protein